MIKSGKHTVIPDDIIYSKDYVDLTFGAFCSIASGLRIVSGQHPPVENPQCVTQFPFKERWNEDYYPCKFEGKVTIGNDVWIGENVTLLDGVVIRDGAIIGAGSTVTNVVPDYCVVAGNPACFIRQRFTHDIIRKLEKIKWWEKSDSEIQKMIPYMKDINLFIEKYGKIV